MRTSPYPNNALPVVAATVEPPVHPAPAYQQPELGQARSASARTSVLVAGSLTLLKAVVALWTGSLAVIASCLDSLLDLFASSVNWFAVRTAEAPPDREHPFGHGKAEYLGGLVQAIVIGASGLYVLGEAVNRLRAPQEIAHTGGAVAMMAVGVVASTWLVRYLRAAARRTDSPALRADSIHYLTDVYSNAGALVALAIVGWTGSSLPDTVAGFVIAALVLYSGFDVLRESVNGLMDHQLPEDRISLITITLLDHPAVVGIHDLRARRSGADKFVQVHVEMDGKMSFDAAHAVAEELTIKIESLLGKATVTVHADPVDVDEQGNIVARPSTEPPLVAPGE